jgi:uncharacterized repeat protein (TIGR01451 family)
LDIIAETQVLKAQTIDIGLAEAIGTSKFYMLTDVERLKLLKTMEYARKITKSYGTRGMSVIETTAVMGRVDGVAVMESELSPREACGVCIESPQMPAKPLMLCKWADKQSGQIGDVVTFTLKYVNLGGQPITEVAVNDSLTGRLEYVPGSAQSSRDAVFTTQANEAGSLILHWEISGKLLPGQSGTVRFQAKIK